LDAVGKVPSATAAYPDSEPLGHSQEIAQIAA
jgi:hypothetical protein